MRIIDCDQGTPEWHAARCGRLTASRIADIMRKTKSGVSKMRQTYAGELVAERLAGIQEEGFTSGPMQWGKEMEDLARDTYAFMHDIDPVRVGFVVHPRLDMAGCSPDSLIGSDGLLQIKCPNTATHIATLLGASIDPDYAKQMQWELACTERVWCDFASFDPRMPAEMQLHTTRVERDDAVISELEREAVVFLDEVSAKVDLLRTRFNLKEQLVKSIAAE